MYFWALIIICTTDMPLRLPNISLHLHRLCSQPVFPMEHAPAIQRFTACRQLKWSTLHMRLSRFIFAFLSFSYLFSTCQAHFSISSLDKWKDKDSLFIAVTFITGSHTSFMRGEMGSGSTHCLHILTSRFLITSFCYLISVCIQDIVQQ